MNESSNPGVARLRALTSAASGVDHGLAPAPEDVAARLLAWLRETFADDRIGYAQPPVRMQGGSHAHVYRFALIGAPPGAARTLVLRLYFRGQGASRVLKESVFQNALARQAYPAPRVHATCTDMTVLGGAFLIMDFLPGAVVLRTLSDDTPEVLGKAHATLHGLNPRGVIESLESLRAQGAAGVQYGVRTELEAIREWAGKHSRLLPVIDWLFANRPPESDPGSICHGDFHPLNLLVQDGRITGVLDWSDCLIADPALDIACTMTMLHAFGQLALPPPAARQAVERYLASYEAHRPFDRDRLDYYRIRRCVIALAAVASGQATQWRHPSVIGTLTAEILRTTGVALSAS